MSTIASNAQTKKDVVFWGLFDDQVQNDISKINNYNDMLGKKPAMIMWYIGWNTTGSHAFPLTTCKTLWDAGYLPNITWEPWLGEDEILSGKWDSDLDQFGKDIATYGNPVMLRWGHEFNGDWYPWSIDGNGTLIPASKWIEAYKYVHDKVVNAGGTNAIWVWSPNNGNGGKNPQDILSYYPGDDYVDWIGMDGYNWGTSQSWSSWSLFSGVFGSLYTKLATKYPTKPIMVAEMGCTSTGGDKAQWITDMFSQTTKNFPHLKAFVWFNINKETDWRFTTDDASTAAFKTGLSDTLLSGDANKLATYKMQVTNIKVTETETFQLFPNPLLPGNELHVKINQTLTLAGTTLKISDILGRAILTRNLKSGETVIDASVFDHKGIYNIQITNGSESMSKIFLVK